MYLNLPVLPLNKPIDQTHVVVAMSGGVDSAVAAALLVDKGFQVTGMMMRLWSEPGSSAFNRCCTPEAMAQARHVAAILNIPFYPVNATDYFHKTVVNYFMDGYTQGITPNPCLVCNRQVRWEFLLNHALALGADFLATGHYARLSYPAGGRIQLLQALDSNKDQSYVLHVLNQEQLSRAAFPLGELQKSEVRELAREFGLPVADREESQDLCFLGNNNYKSFLERHTPWVVKAGPILNRQKEVIGEHQGIAFYTIGQRKGLGISSPAPLYVLEKDIENNAIIVGSQADLGKTELFIDQANWVSIDPPTGPVRAQVKIRYKARPALGTITPQEDGGLVIAFDEPVRDITPGQAAVFYDRDICLGGGLIVSST